MNYIVFFIVLTAACCLIYRVPFIKKSGLAPRLIIVLFLFKVIIGVVQGYINHTYFPWSDTWGINDYSWMEYNMLLTEPSKFFREIYTSNYNGQGYNNVFGSYGSFWNDLELNLLTKGLAPFNFISRGNYYTNSLFFNFFGFFGHIALFRIFDHIYPRKIFPVLAGCFLLPGFLFFSSSIGKDNLLFTLLAMFCFALYFFTLDGFTLKRGAWLLFFFIGIGIMRNHIAVLLIPPAIAFYTVVKTKKNPWLVYGCMSIVLLVLLFAVPAVFPSVNPAAIISQKQQDFLALGEASTQISIAPVEPNTLSLLKNFPGALLNGVFQPYIGNAGNFFMLVQALEILIFSILALWAVIIGFKNGSYTKIHPFVLFGCFFCVAVFVVNGYIVPNSNTLFRYRSIYIPLVIIPVLCNIPGLQNLINIRKINM